MTHLELRSAEYLRKDNFRLSQIFMLSTLTIVRHKMSGRHPKLGSWSWHLIPSSVFFSPRVCCRAFFPSLVFPCGCNCVINWISNAPGCAISALFSRLDFVEVACRDRLTLLEEVSVLVHNNQRTERVGMGGNMNMSLYDGYQRRQRAVGVR